MPTAVKRIATGDAFDGKPGTFHGSMFLDGLDTVFRTGRFESTQLENSDRKKYHSVKSNPENEDLFHLRSRSLLMSSLQRDMFSPFLSALV